MQLQAPVRGWSKVPGDCTPVLQPAASGPLLHPWGLTSAPAGATLTRTLQVSSSSLAWQRAAQVQHTGCTPCFWSMSSAALPFPRQAPSVLTHLCTAVRPCWACCANHNALCEHLGPCTCAASAATQAAAPLLSLHCTARLMQLQAAQPMNPVQVQATNI